MDRILIEGLTCLAHVGVSESERRRRQRILIDLELSLDLLPAGRSDRIEQTVDYAAVVHRVKAIVEGSGFRLVEAMADAVAQVLLREFALQAVRVMIRKFSVPGAESVGVEMVRSRSPDKSRRRSGSPRTGPR